MFNQNLEGRSTKEVGTLEVRNKADISVEICFGKEIPYGKRTFIEKATFTWLEVSKY